MWERASSTLLAMTWSIRDSLVGVFTLYSASHADSTVDVNIPERALREI